MIDDVRTAGMELLRVCDSLQVFQGRNGVARFGILCDLVGQGCQHAAAGRPQVALRLLEMVGGSLIQGLPSGPFRQKVKSAIGEFQRAVGESAAANE